MSPGLQLAHLRLLRARYRRMREQGPDVRSRAYGAGCLAKVDREIRRREGRGARPANLDRTAHSR